MQKEEINIIEEFKRKREAGNGRILGEDYLPFKRFFNLDSAAYTDGAIPPKYKELMGLVASSVLRCNDCIYYHLIKCVELGCTKQEIIETLNIALVASGSINIPHLRVAFEALECLFEDK